MRELVKKWFSAAGMTAGLLLAATPAQAVYNIVLTETGGNVVATGSGSINTAGVTVTMTNITCSGNAGVGAIYPIGSIVCIGTGGAGSYFTGATSPPTLGTGGVSLATSGSGQPVYLANGTVYLPAGYASGAALGNTSTYSGQTLATLGVTVGTYTWSFGSGANADRVVVYAGTTPPSAAVAVTPPPIPDNVVLPAVPGIVYQLKVLDMTSGSGPSMTTCLLGTIKQMFGADATYLGQSPNGAAQVSVGGQTISFYPLAASTSTALGIGAFLTSDNPINVGTSCGTFNVVPAVANMADLGAALTAMGLSAQVDTHGVITATVNGNLYVVRPDYFVTQGIATGTPGLAFGTDGLLRFTDSAGNVQILRAAFLNPVGLQSAMGNALGGTLAIQADGSGVFTRINGSQFALAPEMVLTPASSGLGSPSWVNDRAGHYMYLIAAYYQGLTASAR